MKSRLSQQRHDSEEMVPDYLSVKRWGFSESPKSINQMHKLAFRLFLSKQRSNNVKRLPVRVDQYSMCAIIACNQTYLIDFKCHFLTFESGGGNAEGQ